MYHIILEYSEGNTTGPITDIILPLHKTAAEAKRHAANQVNRIHDGHAAGAQRSVGLLARCWMLRTDGRNGQRKDVTRLEPVFASQCRLVTGWKRSVVQ